MTALFSVCDSATFSIAANHYDFAVIITISDPTLRHYDRTFNITISAHYGITFRAVTERISYVRLRHGLLFKVMHSALLLS